MTTPTVERAAIAAMWWAQKHRRGPEAETAIRAITAGLGRAEQAEWKELLESGALDSLTEDDLLREMTARAGKTAVGAHKIVADAERKIAPGAVLDVTREQTIDAVDPPAAVVDTGSFTGYLAAVGNRDHQGDTIRPGALDASVAEFTAGRQRWLVTDSHSDYGADVVAEVKSAVVDSHGLRVEAVWMPGPKAQALRAMVRAGASLGLSIDYLPRRSRPDGQGGRFLEDVAIIGAAITPKPANPLATIIEGKGLPWPVAADLDAQQERLESWAETAAGHVARNTLAGMVADPAAAIAALSVLSRAQDDAAQDRLERWVLSQPPPPPVDPTVRPDRTSRAELAQREAAGRAMFSPQTRCRVCSSCRYGGPCERYR